MIYQFFANKHHSERLKFIIPEAFSNSMQCFQMNYVQHCLREVVIHFTAFVHSLFNNRSCYRKPARSANVSFFSLASNCSDYSSFSLKILQLTQIDTPFFFNIPSKILLSFLRTFSLEPSAQKIEPLTFKPSFLRLKHVYSTEKT